MANLGISLDNLPNETVFEIVKALCEKAYQQGVEDGAKKYTYPPILKKHSFARDFPNQIGSGDKTNRNRVFPEIENHSS